MSKAEDHSYPSDLRLTSSQVKELCADPSLGRQAHVLRKRRAGDPVSGRRSGRWIRPLTCCSEREQDLETQKRYKQQISDQLFQATQAKNQAKAALADARVSLNLESSLASCTDRFSQRAFEKVRRGLPTAQDRMIQLKDKVEERPEDEVAGLEENKAVGAPADHLGAAFVD